LEMRKGIRNMSKKLISKPALCVNCRICEMACAHQKSGVFSPVKARIWIDKNEKGLNEPVICRHCLRPPCARACPSEKGIPIQRDRKTGIVRFSNENCVGHHACIGACPFGAMRIDPHTGQVFKCDLCGGDPECVKWCPTGALQYVDVKAIGTVILREAS